MDEEAMPSAEERAIELCQYSNRVFGTADAEMCASIVSQTPEYSYRGYCAWGVKREREMLAAAVEETRKRRALVLHVVVCAMLARERKDRCVRIGSDTGMMIAMEIETLHGSVLKSISFS
jgi:hypothetical protein